MRLGDSAFLERWQWGRLEITGALPPNGLPGGEERLTFQVGFRSIDGGEVLVDLGEYGGWRLPDDVELAVAEPGTVAVLSSVSVRLSAIFSDVSFLQDVNRITLYFGHSVSSGRFYLASVKIGVMKPWP